MKIRTVIPHDSTSLLHVELMPDSQGEWDSGAGCIAVCFFEMDMEAGKYFYEPHISVNVRLDLLTPEGAMAWGECFIHANHVAKRTMPDGISHLQSNELAQCWQRVDEFRAKLQGKVTI